MDVERIDLPGIGTSHVVTTARGQRLGIVSHRSGRRDLVIYDTDDPDTSVVSVALNPDEASAIAEYLGTARILEQLAEVQRQVAGLVTEQLVIAPGSPYTGRKTPAISCPACRFTRSRAIDQAAALVRALEIGWAAERTYVNANDVRIRVALVEVESLNGYERTSRSARHATCRTTSPSWFGHSKILPTKVVAQPRCVGSIRVGRDRPQTGTAR